MNTHTLLIWIILFSFNPLISLAQEENGEQSSPISLPQIAPLSPEAFAFQRYGDVPVNMVVGRPDINVPLYVIEGKEMNLPISLTYDASGIKVSQLATSVGLGWNFNYGGAVTRIVRDRPDQASIERNIAANYSRDALGVLYNNQEIYKNYASLNERSTNLQTILAYEESQIDLAADGFQFSVNGFSGTIEIDYDTVLSNGNYKVVCTDHPDVLVTYIGSGTNISSWKITDPNGIQYIFREKETTRYTNQNDNISHAINDTYTSAWYISQIISKNKADTFNFYYTTGVYWESDRHLIPSTTKSSSYIYGVRHAATRSHNPFLSGESFPNFLPFYKIKQFDLTSIYHNGKKMIQTSLNENRLDIKGRKQLNGIQILNPYNTSLNKNINFVQSYFTTNGVPLPQGSVPNQDLVRLKLDEVVFHNTERNAENRYRFEYDSPYNLPNVMSKEQDHLGYYNGSSSNTLIPSLVSLLGEDQASVYNTNIFEGANRRASFPHTKKGILNKMYYPTGGYTEFTYELNQTSPQQNTITQTTQEYSLSITGNTTSGPDFVFNGCTDDVEYDDYHNPNITYQSFTIDDNAITNSTTNIRFSLTHTGSTPNSYNDLQPFYFYCVYEGDEVLSFCQIENMINNGHADIKAYKYFPNNGSFNAEISKGDKHHIFLMSNQANMSVEYEIPIVPVTTSEPQPLYGLRIKEIISKADEVSPPIVKKYEYGDISYQKIRYHKYVSTEDNIGVKPRICGGGFFNKYVCECSPGLFTGQKLITYSHNIAAPSKNEVSYASVREISYEEEDYDDQVRLIGYTEYDLFGVNSTGIPGISYPTYQSNPLGGKIKEIRKYNKDGLLVEHTKNEYVQTFLSRVSAKDYSGFYFFEDLFFKALDHNGNSSAGLINYLGTDPNTGKFRYTFGPANWVCSVAPGGEEGTDGSGVWSCSSPNQCLDHNIIGDKIFYRTVPYVFYKQWARLDKTTITRYEQVDQELDDEIEIVTTTNYYYDNIDHYQATRIETTNSRNETLKTKNYYAHDLGNTDLINQHRIAEPIKSEVFKVFNSGAEQKLSTINTIYTNLGNDMVLPSAVQTAKNNEALENRLEYHKYDNLANPLEVSQSNGSHIVYLWGYDQRYPVAKIENATLSQIAQVIGISEQNLIDNGVTNLSSLNALRANNNLPNALITTYTYQPFVGLASMTDSRGYTTTYEYDAFNRLKHVKDQDGYILNTNEYNYKSQN